MLKNYFKIAWRNLNANKAFSLINIAGLAIGMACTMLILLWVYNERCWDETNKNYSTIYHAMCNRNFNGEITTGPDMMFPLAKAAKAKLPEVQHAAVVSFGENTLFTTGDKKLRKKTITTTDDFFNIFSYDFIAGSPLAIKNPDALILTESTAKALFGNSNVIDQPLKINNGRTAYVKAVIKDVSRNNTVQFDAVIPFNLSSPQIKEQENEWVNCNNRVFVKTQSSVNIAGLEKKMHDLIKENSPSHNPTTRGSVILHPMNKWRLYEEFKEGKNTGGRIQYVNLFTIIAFIILLIACVNFMNLSTARAGKRAREIGIRKTLGSERKQLFGQFMSESMLLSLLAFILALAILGITIPAFSTLLNEDIVVPFSNPMLWFYLLAMVLVTGFLSGSYPAFYLSAFNPVKVLKGTFKTGKNAIMPRKILVTGQFIVSILLISATIIIYQQIQHVKSRNLGYNPENLLLVTASGDANRNFVAIKNDLLQTGLVDAVSRTSSPITDIFGFTSGVSWTGAPPQNNLVIGFFFADEDFAKTVDAKIIEGRDFRSGDSNSVIFNKEAIRLMGIASPLGKEIAWAGNKKRIVGVIDNLVMSSPYEAASPIMINYEDKWAGNINVRLANKADVGKAIPVVENIYKKYSAAYPFEYSFADDDFNLKFNSEQLISTLSVIFASLAIFICCLGLFGLVSFTIEKRNREIGIRKVLGASVQQLLLLMSKEFLVLVGIAFLIAMPAAWWAMNEWLKNFNYRIYVNGGVFVAVGLVTLVIALVTVGLNATGAALKKPVTTLKTE